MADLHNAVDDDTTMAERSAKPVGKRCWNYSTAWEGSKSGRGGRGAELSGHARQAGGITPQGAAHLDGDGARPEEGPRVLGGVYTPAADDWHRCVLGHTLQGSQRQRQCQVTVKAPGDEALALGVPNCPLGRRGDCERVGPGLDGSLVEDVGRVKGQPDQQGLECRVCCRTYEVGNLVHGGVERQAELDSADGLDGGESLATGFNLSRPGPGDMHDCWNREALPNGRAFPDNNVDTRVG